MCYDNKLNQVPLDSRIVERLAQYRNRGQISAINISAGKCMVYKTDPYHF